MRLILAGILVFVQVAWILVVWSIRMLDKRLGGSLHKYLRNCNVSLAFLGFSKVFLASQAECSELTAVGVSNKRQGKLSCAGANCVIPVRILSCVIFGLMMLLLPLLGFSIYVSASSLRRVLIAAAAVAESSGPGQQRLLATASAIYSAIVSKTLRDGSAEPYSYFGYLAFPRTSFLKSICALFVVGIIHELGHYTVLRMCKRKARGFGVGVYLFVPTLFVVMDAISLGKGEDQPSKRQRAHDQLILLGGFFANVFTGLFLLGLVWIVFAVLSSSGSALLPVKLGSGVLLAQNVGPYLDRGDHVSMAGGIPVHNRSDLLFVYSRIYKSLLREPLLIDTDFSLSDYKGFTNQATPDPYNSSGVVFGGIRLPYDSFKSPVLLPTHMHQHAKALRGGTIRSVFSRKHMHLQPEHTHVSVLEPYTLEADLRREYNTLISRDPQAGMSFAYFNVSEPQVPSEGPRLDELFCWTSDIKSFFCLYPCSGNLSSARTIHPIDDLRTFRFHLPMAVNGRARVVPMDLATLEALHSQSLDWVSVGPSAGAPAQNVRFVEAFDRLLASSELLVQVSLAMALLAILPFPRTSDGFRLCLSVLPDALPTALFVQAFSTLSAFLLGVLLLLQLILFLFE